MAAGNSSHLVVVLILIMLVCDISHGVAHSNSYEMYEMYPKDDNQQFYCDQVNVIKVEKERWVQVVFHNLSSYWEGVQAFEKVTRLLEKTCETIDRELCTNLTCETMDNDLDLCTNMTHQLTLELKELQLSNELLLMHRDSRRTPIVVDHDGADVTNLTDTVLEKQLAEKYINAIQQNMSSLSNFSKNSTSIIQSQYLQNLFNGTEQIVAEEQETINKHFKTLDNILNNPQHEINTTNLLQELTVTVLAASRLSKSLNVAQGIIFDVLNNTHYGQFSISLHPRGQFYRAYNFLYLDGPTYISRMRFQSSYLNLLSSTTTKARITKQYFIFETIFPLRKTKQKFKLYKISPLSQQTKNITNVSSFEYIVTDVYRKSFMSVTSEEVSLCKEIDMFDMFLERVLMCDWKEPFNYLKGEANFCVDRYPRTRYTHSKRCFRIHYTNNTINNEKTRSRERSKFKNDHTRLAPIRMTHVAIGVGTLLLGLFLMTMWRRQRQNALVPVDTIPLATSDGNASELTKSKGENNVIAVIAK